MAADASRGGARTDSVDLARPMGAQQHGRRDVLWPYPLNGDETMHEPGRNSKPKLFNEYRVLFAFRGLSVGALTAQARVTTSDC